LLLVYLRLVSKLHTTFVVYQILKSNIMKIKFFSTALLLFTTFVVAFGNPIEIDLLIRGQVFAKYKNAVIIETEKENQNIKVEIIHQHKEKDLIFNSQGVWQSTKYDISKSELPNKIKTALKNSQYSSYRIDDIEVIETPTKSIYEIDLDKIFGDDITIYVTFDGEIL